MGVGIAVVGAGYWGPTLIGNFDNLERSDLHWVVERDSNRAKQIRDRFGRRLPVVTDLAQALEDDRVDAVVVATPTSTHFAIGQAALEAGKHVLMEKPLAATSGQGEALMKLADERGLILMVGHVFLYNPAVRAIKAFLDGGELGNPLRIDMNRKNLGPIRHDVNAAWDLMPHDLSMLRYWLDSEPTSVMAWGGHWLKDGNHDSVTVGLEYPGGVQAVINANWLAARKNRDIEIIGDRQMLVFDDNHPTEKIRIFDQGVEGLPERSDEVAGTMTEFLAQTRFGDIHTPRLPAKEPLAEECAHFVECVESGQEPLTTAADGLAVVRTLEAIDRSLKSKREVKIQWPT